MFCSVTYFLTPVRVPPTRGVAVAAPCFTGGTVRSKWGIETVYGVLIGWRGDDAGYLMTDGMAGMATICKSLVKQHIHHSFTVPTVQSILL